MFQSFVMCQDLHRRDPEISASELQTTKHDASAAQTWHTDWFLIDVCVTDVHSRGVGVRTGSQAVAASVAEATHRCQQAA